MKTPIEVSLELEDKIREQVKARFPNLDPDWVIKRSSEKRYRNSKGMAEALFTTIFKDQTPQEGNNAASEKN